MAATVAFTLIVVAWVYQLWDADFRYPWLAGSGDGLLGLSIVKGMIEHGWFFTNPSVGVPEGQQQFDFAAQGGDVLQALGLRIIALFTSNPSAVVNIYFLLGFVFVAASAYAVLRLLDVSRPTAMVCGVLFTLLPYHFVRGQGHLVLGAYFAIPLGCWLFVRTLLGEPLVLAGTAAGRVRRWLTAPTIATVVAVVVCGASTLYYAVFTALLVAAAAILRAASQRHWRSLVPGAIVSAIVLAVLLVSISPGVVYQAANGKNQTVAERQAYESETYSLSFTKLVVPSPRHRIEKLARAGMRFTNHTGVPGEGGMELGFILALSFVGLLFFLVSFPLRAGPAPAWTGRLAVAAAIGAALAFLIATFGGISSLIAYYFTPQIRGWDRMVPFIAFFAAIGLALALDGLRARLATRPRGTALGAAVLVAVALIGVLDQTAPSRPAYAADQASWRADGRFVAAVERIAPDDGMVLQLPFRPYPEAGAYEKMHDYDLFRGYIHSRDLRWSYGAMKGRPDDWSDEATAQRLGWVVPAAVAEGFVGVYIDRFGYRDNGRAAERQIQAALGVDRPTVVSANRRLAYYDATSLRSRLRSRLSVRERQELGDALVEPLDVTFGPGFSDPGVDGDKTWRDVTGDATITLDNPDDQPRPVAFAGSARGEQGTVSFEVPGRAPVEVRLDPDGRSISIPYQAPPGRSAIRVHVEGSGARSQPKARLFSPRIDNRLPGDLGGA